MALTDSVVAPGPSSGTLPMYMFRQDSSGSGDGGRSTRWAAVSVTIEGAWGAVSRPRELETGGGAAGWGGERLDV